MTKFLSLGALALIAPRVLAQSCISLAGSTTCPAFNASSISTDQSVVDLYPFLAYVSSTEDFDTQLSQYVSQQYVQSKYINIFGCDNVNLGNTSTYYARYTLSFICNGIVQNSRELCGLSAADSEPLCADSCADLALSEEQIVSSDLCQGRNSDYADQLRADFTNCALPANSISGSCITGESNEPADCGFGSNLMGLCNFCRASTENGTDSCCVTSNSTGRCQGVTLPVFSTISNLFSSTTSPTSSPTGTATGAASSGGGNGLDGGQIAGIVVGSVVGFILLLALIVLGVVCLRRRRHDSKAGSLLNQPSPQRKGVASSAYNQPMSQPGYEVLPGGRVARMSALQDDQPGLTGPPGIGPRNYTSHTDPYGDSPESRDKAMGVGAAAAAAAKHGGSPGSDSQNGSSPGDFSSPEGVASGQSEQLPFFKDYYSNDDIHPGDKVSVLWAYQPRAGDEFELERGDMLKVVGIWDDGWATGVRINDRAEDYDGKHKVQRDSGVSNGSAARDESPTPSGEIKAFPLVCVCLPEAWKKTVEGDASTEGGSGGPPPT
ncbi:uncharacterized protein Z518_10931 [Rhinocladiella mackenziei CBS 650.93]|uniref:SH3 domain-containing protein n=1 Tax=Rhinocladiella mackenziei CBS 650.93 TaxID=1442369 RepID=A0A0D2I2R1_9EURO|nr:uncharacterized protein Z518_10931 [Rhinocladiella mackenziei CBS 650.93]KIX00004.1 hypothetical protein Z518_10931 [Rhinocladiella mackenziei CBS 650.93]